MEDRPQHPVGEAVVIFLIVRRGEIGDDIGQAAVLDCPRGDVLVDGNRPAPAEPKSAVALEQRRTATARPPA